MASSTAPGSIPIPVEDPSLPPDIRPVPTHGSAPGPDVVLTGATGYLGAYLLRELLATTTGTVWCLVRADDDTAAQARLTARCAELGLAPTRAVAIAGDFTRSRL